LSTCRRVAAKFGEQGFVGIVDIGNAACGMTRYGTWIATGIDQSTLSKFVTGKAALPTEAIDKPADLLELNLTMGKAPIKDRGKRKGG
jgi:hypothetical protein